MKNKIEKKEIVLLVHLYNSQKFGECEIEIRKLIKKYTNDEKLFDMLGLTLSAQKKYNESIKCFNQATAIKANYYEAYNNLGNVLLKLRKKQEAINCFLKVIENKPETGKTLIWLAYWTHAHTGEILNSGTKYIIKDWMHFAISNTLSEQKNE